MLQPPAITHLVCLHAGAGADCGGGLWRPEVQPYRGTQVQVLAGQVPGPADRGTLAKGGGVSLQVEARHVMSEPTCRVGCAPHACMFFHVYEYCIEYIHKYYDATCHTPQAAAV